MPTAAILAGGQSRRMGHDKAEVHFRGKRLIDHVVQRLEQQADQIVLSAAQDYATGFPTVADAYDFQGPVAGLFGVADWLEDRRIQGNGFLTAPVDGPFLPEDLAVRLASDPTQCGIAVDETGKHPTFAFWTLQALRDVRASLSQAPSLHHLAELTDARIVAWPGKHNFINFNTPDDLANMTV